MDEKQYNKISKTFQTLFAQEEITKLLSKAKKNKIRSKQRIPLMRLLQYLRRNGIHVQTNQLAKPTNQRR